MLHRLRHGNWIGLSSHYDRPHIDMCPSPDAVLHPHRVPSAECRSPHPPLRGTGVPLAHPTPPACPPREPFTLQIDNDRLLYSRPLLTQRDEEGNLVYLRQVCVERWWLPIDCPRGNW